MFDVCKRSNVSFACMNNYWPKALIAWPSGRTLPSRGWRWRGEGGVESSSEKGQRHIRLYNSSPGVWTWWNPLYVQSFYLRDLHIHLTLRGGWFRMEDIIQFAYKDMSSDIAAFLESLYEQKHAFYFRRVREWHEFHQVNFCIHGLYASKLYICRMLQLYLVEPLS